MRWEQVVGVIGASQGKGLSVFNFPSLAGSNLSRTQVTYATRVSKDLCSALRSYGCAFSQLDRLSETFRAQPVHATPELTKPRQTPTALPLRGP